MQTNTTLLWSHFSWQRTSRQLQRCHSAAFSSRLLPNAAEWHRCSCVPTVPQCKIGSAKCSNFKPQSVHLPRYWPMDWWLPRAIDADKHHVAVVSFFPGRGPPDNYSGVIPRHFPAGCCQMQRSDTAVVCRLFHSARSAQQSAATSSHRACIWRDIGRWIGDYLGRSMQTNTTLLWSHFFLAEDLQTTTAVSFRGIFQQVAAKCSGVTAAVVCRLFHSARSAQQSAATSSRTNFRWWLPSS